RRSLEDDRDRPVAVARFEVLSPQVTEPVDRNELPHRPGLYALEHPIGESFAQLRCRRHAEAVLAHPQRVEEGFVDPSKRFAEHENLPYFLRLRLYAQITL